MFLLLLWEKCYSMRNGNVFDMTEFDSSFFFSFFRHHLCATNSIVCQFAYFAYFAIAAYTPLVAQRYHFPVPVTLTFLPSQRWRARPKPKLTLCFWLMAPGVLAVSTSGPSVRSLPGWLESLTSALTGYKLVGQTELNPTAETNKELFLKVFCVFSSCSIQRRPEDLLALVRA